MSLLLSQLGAKSVVETVGVSAAWALSSSDRLLRILKARKAGLRTGPWPLTRFSPESFTERAEGGGYLPEG